MIQAANRRPEVVSFTAEDIRDVYEMRLILECEAAARAAETMDRPTLTRLADTLKTFRATRGVKSRLAHWVKLDDEFHRAIATASGSPRLAADVERYRQLHRIFNRSHTDAAVLEQAADEHEDILRGLDRRDGEAAREAMRNHLEEWQRFFVNHLRGR
jgi:DNA-binding GntR family transcriptional regulator